MWKGKWLDSVRYKHVFFSFRLYRPNGRKVTYNQRRYDCCQWCFLTFCTLCNFYFKKITRPTTMNQSKSDRKWTACIMYAKNACSTRGWLSFVPGLLQKSMFALIGQIALGEGCHHKTKVMRSSPDRAVRVRAPAGDIVLCSCTCLINY